MATVDMNVVHFYNPSSTEPSLSAKRAATLQKYRQSTEIPHRKGWSRVLESYSQSLTIAGEQDGHASHNLPPTDEDDEFPPIDEVIRQAQHREDSTDKPTNSALASQGPDRTSFLDGSGSSKLAQSSLIGHLDGSKEQPVILEDDDNSDDDDNGDDGDNDKDSVGSSSRDISSDSNTDNTGQELGPPLSRTTPYPGSGPSSSYDPSLHPSAAPHDQSQEDRAIQQDDGYISCERLEEPSCATLILLDDRDDETEKVRQQQVVEGREEEARNSETSSNGDIDIDENHLQDDDEYDGPLPTKQRKLSPSYDPTIRSGCKRRLQHFDESVSTIQLTQQRNQETGNEKEQEAYDGNIGSSRSDNDYDHRDDQNSDSSDGPRLAKRRRPSPSSSEPTQKHHSQRSHKSHTAPAQTQLEQSSSMAPTITSIGEHELRSNTSAEYQEWPIRGVLKRVIVGDEVRYGMDFSLGEPQAVTCSQHIVAHQSTDGGDSQPSELWDIHRITGARKVDGVEEFRVAWAQTWMLESDLGGARELVDEFKAKLSVRQRNKNGQGKTDVVAERLSKKRRGRPRKQS